MSTTKRSRVEIEEDLNAHMDTVVLIGALKEGGVPQWYWVRITGIVGTSSDEEHEGLVKELHDKAQGHKHSYTVEYDHVWVLHRMLDDIALWVNDKECGASQGPVFEYEFMPWSQEPVQFVHLYNPKY